jgi:hypothetical protein
MKTLLDAFRALLRHSALTPLCLLATFLFPDNVQARVLVATNSTWRYFKGTSEASDPTNAWRELNFDDSAWLIGAAPFHFGTNAVGGDDAQTGGTILTDMRSNYTCIFLRQTFVIEDTNRLVGLVLNAWFDDGSAIWINGQAPRSPLSVNGLAYTNIATGATREANPRIRVDISSAFGTLRNGTNVLCLQAFNGHLTNDDFRIDAELTETRTTLTFTVSSTNVSENAGQVTLIVQRSGSQEAVSVDYVTTNSTAVAGEDYLATNGTLVFAQGETMKTVVVSILNDSRWEARELFQVKLLNPGTGAEVGAIGTVALYIDDNDPGFQVEFPNYWVNEDAGPVVIGVLRGDDGSFPSTVDLLTADGTAVADQDYTATNGTLTFAAGERLKLIPVDITNDGVSETDETFTITLHNPSNGTVLGAVVTATVTIRANDPGVGFAPNHVYAHEDQAGAWLNARRGNDGVLGAFTVDYIFKDGTASNGVDYLGTNGTLVFAAGEMSKRIWFASVQDHISEVDKTFTVTLTNFSGGIPPGPASDLTATVTLYGAAGMEPNRFGAVRRLENGAMRLELVGSVHQRFRDYYSLFPLGVSEDLIHWRWLGLAVRANSNSSPAVFVDPDASGRSQRFYRLAATNLIAPLNPPTGPYPVGQYNRCLSNPSRRRYYAQTGTDSVMLSVWYPAAPLEPRLPERLFEDSIVTDPDYWLPTGGIDWKARVGRFSSYSITNAPLRTNSSGYPLVLYSQGGGGDWRKSCYQFAEELASHGYIVAAIDHWDLAFTVFPDGTLYKSPGVPALDPEGLSDRVQDLFFLVDELERMHQTDPILKGGLDLGHVAATGVSWGGTTAAEYCRLDARCQALIGLDIGRMQDAPDLVQFGLQKPMLLLNNPSANSEPLFTLATQDVYASQISDIIHNEFLSLCYWYYRPQDLATRRENTRTINACTLSFLNKYLKGQNDGLLDGNPSLVYPRLINFKKK